MGKIKRKEHSESHYLKGIIKKLKAENKSLKQHLKFFEKREHFYEDNPNDDECDNDPIILPNSCPRCKNGKLSEVDLHKLIITKCDNCEYQTKKRSK